MWLRAQFQSPVVSARPLSSGSDPIPLPPSGAPGKPKDFLPGPGHPQASEPTCGKGTQEESGCYRQQEERAGGKHPFREPLQ